LTDIDAYAKVSTDLDILTGGAMSRVQLALNVADIDAAVDFYSKLFATEPAKRRPGYANFAVAEPPLKLVLIESPGADGRLNHLGVEVTSADQVAATQARLRDEGLATTAEDGVTCCYAVQDKVWVDDPDGAAWEVYTVLADAEQPGGGELRTADQADEAPEAPCCSVTPDVTVARSC
jgi:catechol 2,3-dioxygenase-like lactoylglutathione lyase family enzyme